MEKSFLRLQLEILKVSDDESIFAWEGYTVTYGKGLLASSPDEFANSGNVCRADYDTERPPFSMTNKGLRIELILIRQNGVIIAPLNCARERKDAISSADLEDVSSNPYLALRLEKVDDRGSGFTRSGRQRSLLTLDPSVVEESGLALKREVVFVRQSVLFL
jgi:hypothetical protein